MKRRIFDRQFKIEAVRLACSVDMTVTQTARTLNISTTTLYRWIAEWEQGMSIEIARLKRQMAERDEERAILEKATTYFASA